MVNAESRRTEDLSKDSHGDFGEENFKMSSLKFPLQQKMKKFVMQRAPP